MPPPVITYSGDRYRTRRRTPVSTTNKVPGYDLTFPTTLNEMAKKDGQPPYIYGGDTVIESVQDLIDIEAGLLTRSELEALADQ